MNLSHYPQKFSQLAQKLTQRRCHLPRTARIMPTHPQQSAFGAPALSLLAAITCLSAATIPSTVAGPLAQFRTPLGDIEVELFDRDKPVTVQNFIRYVERGQYTNMMIHRWVPRFVIQGGGFFITNRLTAGAAFSPVPTFGTITNEYSVGPTLSNTYGTLAMARVGGQINSATSQWFFNLTNNTFLDQVDGGFTVFGVVRHGTNVLERFNNTSTTNGIYRANLQGALSELPVLSPTPTYEDLVYVDITLLKVQVKTASAGREISWNSIRDKLNRVEFTETFPPLWQTLVQTNGTGNRLQVVDADPAAPHRFYRVRIDF